MLDAAKYAVSDAMSEGVVLDYSWESIARLEAAIDRLFAEPGVRLVGRLLGKRPQSRRTQRYAWAYGAYLAEVIRKRYPGSWSNESKLYPGTQKLTFCIEAGIDMWPHERIMKRVQNGAEDNLSHYIAALETQLSERDRDDA